MKEAIEKLTNAVGRLEQNQTHVSLLDTEIRSAARGRARQLPTRRSTTFVKRNLPKVELTRSEALLQQ